MKNALLVVCILLAGCASAPPPLVKVADPTADPAYGRGVEELAKMYREASGLLESKKADEAGAILTKAQPMIEKVLSVPRPTRAALEVSSNLDQMYGQMLLSNHHYGWARMMFQKNLARWKNAVPQDEDTARRLKLAVDSIAECDRNISQ